MDIKIEKGIYMPIGREKNMSKKYREAIIKMEVGDSFAFDLCHYVLLRSILTKIHNDPADQRIFATRALDADKRRAWRVQ